MKMIKSLILGSAAGLVAVGGAQAADLPVKAKAVEYVKVCSLYGAGFFYIPGTDTCIKLGGYLRVDVLANTNADDTGNVSAPGGLKNRFTNGYTWRSREDLNIDTRTATEYGVVRTFFDATFSWTSDSYGGNPAAAGSTVYSPLGGGSAAATTGIIPTGQTIQVPPASAPNNANAGGVALGTLGVYYAYIQFAGFTIGKAVSQFSLPWSNYPGNNFDGLVGGGGDVTGVNQFSYTAQFGNGISASISAQDQVAYYQAGVQNLSSTTANFGASDYAGTIAPDIVGQFRVDQAWGLFQLSAAAHDNHAAYYGTGGVAGGGVETSGHPDDKWGFAVQAGLSINNIPTGAGDTINMSGVYTDGATRYNIQDLASAYGGVTLFGSTGLAGAYQSVAFAAAPDTVFQNGTAQHSIKTWGFRGGYTHNWNPNWNTSLYGAYAAVMYDDFSKTAICGANGLGGAGTSFLAITGGSCNPDYNIGQLGLITRWTPVKNLTFSADVTWSHIDQKSSGTVSPTVNVANGKPAAVYELRDQSNVLLLLRAQRNW